MTPLQSFKFIACLALLALLLPFLLVLSWSCWLVDNAVDTLCRWLGFDVA